MSFEDRGRRAARFRAGALTLMLLGASNAYGQELHASETSRSATSDPNPLEAVRYTAPLECPSEARFSEILREKGVDSLSTERTHFASVRFELRATKGGYEAAVLGTTLRGQPIERRVSGATCSETAEALALIWTLVLRESREEAEEVVPPPAVVEPPPPIEKETKREDDDSEQAPTTATSGGFEARALFAGTLGRSPEFAPTALVTLGIGFGSRSLFFPLVRVGASLGFETVTQVGSGSAHFSSYLGRLELCPFRAKLGLFTTFRLCEVNDGGVLLARGRGFEVTREVVARVFGVGALAAFEFRTKSGVGLELGFEAKAELLTSEFELDRKLVFSTPHASGSAYLGIRFDTFEDEP